MKNKNFTDFPQHTSLTKDTFLYSTKKVGDFGDYKGRRWFALRKIYSYIYRFWGKHVGENYNECRKKLFCNLKEKFRYSKEFLSIIHTDLNLISTKPCYWFNEFVIDENGNIYKNKRSWKRSHLTYKIDNRVIHGYVFDKSDFTKEEIDRVIKRVGRDKINHIFNEVITPEEYKKLNKLLNVLWIAPGPVDIETKAHPIVDGEFMEIKRKTPKHKQCRQESIDAYKKRERERMREKLKKEESLLHDIEEERKIKERKENSIKIIKHGFDEETSFRGEEYHGGKRKRK